MIQLFLSLLLKAIYISTLLHLFIYIILYIYKQTNLVLKDHVVQLECLAEQASLAALGGFDMLPVALGALVGLGVREFEKY